MWLPKRVPGATMAMTEEQRTAQAAVLVGVQQLMEADTTQELDVEAYMQSLDPGDFRSREAWLDKYHPGQV